MSRQKINGEKKATNVHLTLVLLGVLGRVSGSEVRLDGPNQGGRCSGGMQVGQTCAAPTTARGEGGGGGRKKCWHMCQTKSATQNKIKNGHTTFTQRRADTLSGACELCELDRSSYRR